MSSAIPLGFDALAQRVADWTPERAEAITGVGADRIRTLAHEYAGQQPAAIRVNYGLQRHYGGGMAVRTIACLPALVGAWRRYGGGIQLSASGYFRHLDRTQLYRPDLLAGRTPRRLNMNRLGDALSTDPARLAQAHYHPRPVDRIPDPQAAGPLVKALIVYNCNPAAVCPDQAAVRRGLQREDLFTVVLEQFQTDTADYADYVLPATTQLEHWDILKPYGHTHLALNRPAIAPLGESLPNSEIFRRLAAAMGYDDPCFHEGDEQMLREPGGVPDAPALCGHHLGKAAGRRVCAPGAAAALCGLCRRRLPHAERQVRVLQRAAGTRRLRPAARLHGPTLAGSERQAG